MGLRDIIQPRVVELGGIRIGSLGDERTAATSGRKYRMPQKLDHFIITGLDRDEDGLLREDETLMQELIRECGDPDGKLREIPIALLSDEIEDSLTASFVYYKGTKCIAYSDGKELTQLRDMQTGEKLPEPTTGPWKPGMEERPGWRLYSIFSCVIASSAGRWGGVYKFRTTSSITSSQLLSSLDMVKTLTHGVLQGVPLKLVVRPKRVAPDGKATTVYVVHVELRGEDLNAVQQTALKIAQHRVENRKQMAQMRLGLQQLSETPQDTEGTPRGDEDAQLLFSEESEPEEAEVVQVSQPLSYGEIADQMEPDNLDSVVSEFAKSLRCGVKQDEDYGAVSSWLATEFRDALCVKLLFQLVREEDTRVIGSLLQNVQQAVTENKIGDDVGASLLAYGQSKFQ